MICFVTLVVINVWECTKKNLWKVLVIYYFVNYMGRNTSFSFHICYCFLYFYSAVMMSNDYFRIKVERWRTKYQTGLHVQFLNLGKKKSSFVRSVWLCGLSVHLPMGSFDELLLVAQFVCGRYDLIKLAIATSSPLPTSGCRCMVLCNLENTLCLLHLFVIIIHHKQHSVYFSSFYCWSCTEGAEGLDKVNMFLSHCWRWRCGLFI